MLTVIVESRAAHTDIEHTRRWVVYREYITFKKLFASPHSGLSLSHINNDSYGQVSFGSPAMCYYYNEHTCLHCHHTFVDDDHHHQQRTNPTFHPTTYSNHLKNCVYGTWEWFGFLWKSLITIGHREMQAPRIAFVLPTV